MSLCHASPHLQLRSFPADFSIQAWVCSLVPELSMMLTSPSLPKLLLVAGSVTGSMSIVNHRNGVPTWDLHRDDVIQLTFDSVVIEAVYDIGILIAKVSILLQIRRIFAPTRTGNATIYYSATALILATTLFYIIEVVLAFLQCSPRARVWNKNIPGTCITRDDADLYGLPSASLNVLSDFLILFLPLNRVWRLQIPQRKQILISLVFAIGIMWGIPYSLRKS